MLVCPISGHAARQPPEAEVLAAFAEAATKAALSLKYTRGRFGSVPAAARGRRLCEAEVVSLLGRRWQEHVVALAKATAAAASAANATTAAMAAAVALRGLAGNEELQRKSPGGQLIGRSFN